MGLDGLVILGGFFDGIKLGLIEVRQILSIILFFWWVLPDHSEAGLFSAWLS
jgi:hypothetical protein